MVAWCLGDVQGVSDRDASKVSCSQCNFSCLLLNFTGSAGHLVSISGGWAKKCPFLAAVHIFFGAVIRMEWSRPHPRFYLELQMPQCKVCTTPKTDNNSQMRERPLNRLKGQPAEKMVTHCLTSLFRLLLQLYLHHDCFLSWIPPRRADSRATTLPIWPRKVWRGAGHCTHQSFLSFIIEW